MAAQKELKLKDVRLEDRESREVDLDKERVKSSDHALGGIKMSWT